MNDGGAAFPSRKFVGGHLDTVDVEGMTLRDYFAAAALTAAIIKCPLLKDIDEDGILPKIPLVTEETGIKIRAAIARLAYDYADAMLERREAK